MFEVKVRSTGRVMASFKTREEAEEYVLDCEVCDEFNDEYEDDYYQIAEVS